MPIIDLQFRLRQLGTLRTGELVTKNGKTYPSTRDTWRGTFPSLEIAEQFAAKFGGTPHEWDSKSTDKWVVDTDTDTLPIAVLPGHAISQWLELWSGGGCLRRCDGVEEVISGGECLCDPEARECKPITRLSVVVRGIDALGLFRLNTGSYYAAVELGGAVAFLEQRTAKGETPEGSLRIEERRVVREGKTKVFKIVVLDVAYGLERALPVGQSTAKGTPVLREGADRQFTPLAELPAGVTVEEGLELANQKPKTRNGKQAAPLPEQDDIPFGDQPIPVGYHTSPEPELDDPGKVSVDQKTALNALYGELTRADKITTEQVYRAVCGLRQNIDLDVMVELIDGKKLNGQLSFAKLRDSLSKTEASNLIDRLGRLADNVKANA